MVEAGAFSLGGREPKEGAAVNAKKFCVITKIIL